MGMAFLAVSDGSASVDDTPGVVAKILSGLDYRHRLRPLFPLEPDAVYEGVAAPLL
jgi:hypothetical protein